MSSPSGFPQASSSAQIPHTDEQAEEDERVLVEAFLPPPDYIAATKIHLPQPFCLPQISRGYDTPFARGYNPTLELSQAEILAFLDGLNLAIVASPPLRVVDTVGQILGFVPYHWAIIAGIGIQTVAQTGMHILSKTLTDRYLRAANKRLFEPRGLVTRLYTTAALTALLDGTTKPKSAGRDRLDKVGRGVGSVVLRLPIPFAGLIVRAVADKPPEVKVGRPGDGDIEKRHAATRRYLALVEGRTLPVDLNVPDPAPPSGFVDKIQAFGLKLNQRKVDKTRRKADKKRMELEMERMEDEQCQQMFGERSRRARKGQRRGPIRTLLGAAPRGTKLERRVAKADLLEHWSTRRILWVVIMNAEEEHVQDVEIADSDADQEFVSEKVWDDELRREKQHEDNTSGEDSD